MIKQFNIHLYVCFRGYSLGVRLIEDFLARSNIGRCTDFRETADIISKVSPIIYCPSRLGGERGGGGANAFPLEMLGLATPLPICKNNNTETLILFCFRLLLRCT